MGEVWRPWRLLGASFWEAVTSLKLPPQKNEVPRGDLEEFWLDFEASGLDFRSILGEFLGLLGVSFWGEVTFLKRRGVQSGVVCEAAWCVKR